MKLVFLDTETTGLDHIKHEIIEIAFVIFENSGDEWTHSEVVRKIKPCHIETAQPKALEINGYNEKDWQEANAQEWDLQFSLEVKNILRNSMIIGHNPMFDMRFIERQCSIHGIKLPRRPVFDTMCAGYLLGHQFLGMDKIRAAEPEMTTEGAHRALKDVEDCVFLFSKVFKIENLSKMLLTD